MKNFKDSVDTMNLFFKNNNNILCEKNDIVTVETNQDKLPLLIPDTDFYKKYQSCKIKWRLKEGNENDLRFTGSLNMLTVQEIIKDWKSIVYFDSTPIDNRNRLFKPVDLFSDDACAGFFTDDKKNIMHLYNYEGTPVSLGLTVDDYVLTAMDFGCFYFWHYVILFFINGQENEVISDYSELVNQCSGLHDINELKKIFTQRNSI